MNKFVTFSHTDHEVRTAVKISENGKIMLLRTARHGEVIESIDERIDPLRAADIIADGQLLAPSIPTHSGGGDYSIGFGVGEAAPELLFFHGANMSHEAHEFVGRVHRLIGEISKSKHAPVQAAPAAEAPFDWADFVLWTGGTFVGHLVVVVLSLVCFALLVATAASALSSSPLLALLLGVGGSLVVVVAMNAGYYYLVGMLWGRLKDDPDDVFKPAMAAILLPAIISFFAGGGFIAGGMTFAYPFVARYAARRARAMRS